MWNFNLKQNLMCWSFHVYKCNEDVHQVLGVQVHYFEVQLGVKKLLPELFDYARVPI